MKKLILLFTTLFLSASCLFCEIYKANAEASFYADKFHGRKTANGEIFNMYDFTAAHKTLPFNTILKVTNISNGRSVTVRVNDRGPFVQCREIDLSKAAAEKLDMISSGTAKVSIEILQQGNGKSSASTAVLASKAAEGSSDAVKNPARPAIERPAAKESAEKTEKVTNSSVNEEIAVLIEEPEEDLRWDIQVGSFSEKVNAENFAQRLLKAGFKNVVYQKAGGITRVVIRDNPTGSVQPLLDKLENNGFKDYLVKRRQ